MSDYYDKECAWCDKDMGRVETGNDEYEGTSHGICEDCVEEHFSDDDDDSDSE